MHTGARFAYKDCDSDGIPDPTCTDTNGYYGVIKSSKGCVSEWPHAKCDTEDKKGGTFAIKLPSFRVLNFSVLMLLVSFSKS